MAQSGKPSCVLLTCSHHSLSTSLISVIIKYFSLILYFFCSSPGICCFSKKLQFPLVLKDSIQKPRLEVFRVLMATGVLLLLGTLSKQSQEMYVCIYMCMYSHTYSFVNISVSIVHMWYNAFPVHRRFFQAFPYFCCK